MHINKKDLIEFDNGNMNTQEVIEFLSHLDHCDFCLDQMMEQEDSSTDTAPAYLMEQILDKADSGEVQLARAANQASRKIRLLHYSLQTAAGVQTEYCPNMKTAGSTSSPENSDRTLVMAPVLL